MRNSCQILVAMAFLAILSAPPAFGRGRSRTQLVMEALDKALYYTEKGIDLYDGISSLNDLLGDPIGKFFNNAIPDAYSEGAKDENPIPIPVGFYITFYIGSESYPVTALLSTSSTISRIYNYNPSNSSTLKCCDNSGCISSDPTATSPCSGGQLPSDQFTLNSTNITDVMFRTSNTEGSSLDATGVVSFSWSKYSLINSVERKIFSYFFSLSGSYFSMGYVPESTSRLESTKLVQLPKYPNFYTISLTEISIGDSPITISPTATVILTTVIPVTLLEPKLYKKVSKVLSNIRNSSSNNEPRGPVCFKNNPPVLWPNITLSFPSRSGANAQMVLTKNNYVINDNKLGVECAAIIQSPEAVSVIGTMAQLNRKTVFDLSSHAEPTLYFSRYSEDGSSADQSQTMPNGLLVEESPMSSPMPLPSKSPIQGSKAAAGSLMTPCSELLYFMIFLLLVLYFHIPG